MHELTPSWFIHVDWTSADTRQRAVAERFELKAPIGRGGSAEVWHAYDPGSGRDVAVKVLVHELAREPAYQTRLRHEARAVARLWHPNIVHVFDVGTLGMEVERATRGRIVAGSPFVVMERIHGGTALSLLKEARPWSELRRHAQAVLSALVHAHARDVVHLDIKPSNLLVEADELVLADFGTAQILRESQELSPATLAYAAPEQLIGDHREVGPRSDLFALGCVIWEWVTGESALPDGSVAERAFATPRPFKPRMDVPKELHPWLLRMLEGRPGRRMPSATHARSTLPGAAPPNETTTAAGEARRQGRSRKQRPDLAFGLGLFELARMPFIGREAERAKLWACAEEAFGGKGQSVELVGPAGAGTTRLAEWLVTRVRETDLATVLRVPAGSSLQHALHRHFAVSSHATERALRRIEREVGAHWSIDAFLKSDGSLDDAAAALVEAMARRRPVLLWWEGAPSARLRGPVLSLQTTRAGESSESTTGVATGRKVLDIPISPHPNGHEDPELNEGRRTRTCIRLGAFSTAARDTLQEYLRLPDNAMEALGGEQLPGELLARIGAWIASGQLQLHEGTLRFVPQKASSEGEAPWEQRLDGLAKRLSEGEFRALELIAVLGAQVETELWGLAAFGANTTPTLAALDRMVVEGLAQVENERIQLSNDAIASLLLRRAKRRLRAYHLASAEALRKLPNLRRAKERLGRHLFAAQRWEEAASALELGARARLRALDPRGALALLDLLLETQHHRKEDERAAIRALLLRSVCERRLEDPSGRTTAKSALLRARELGDRSLIAEAAYGRAKFARARGDFDRAMRHLLEARGAAEDAEDDELRADILLDLLSVLVHLGMGERAEAMWSDARDERPCGLAMLQLMGARIARSAGRFDAARNRAQECARIFEDAAPRLLPEAWWERAAIERAAGELDHAAEFYRRALEGQVCLGTSAARVELELGLTLCELGELEGASTHLRGARAAWRAQGRERQSEGWSLALAWASALAGEWEDCVRSARDAIRLDDAEWQTLYARLWDMAESHGAVREALLSLTPAT